MDGTKWRFRETKNVAQGFQKPSLEWWFWKRRIVFFLWVEENNAENRAVVFKWNDVIHHTAHTQ